jgi:hypothetical protein
MRPSGSANSFAGEKQAKDKFREDDMLRANQLTEVLALRTGRPPPCRPASSAITAATASHLTSQAPMPIRLSGIAALAYAAIYFLLASVMEAEYVKQNYPTIYVGISMIAQLLTVAGVVLFALDAGADFVRLWRWIFPLLVFDFALGVYFDSAMADPPGDEWLWSLALSLWFMAPAYYCNFKIARYGLLCQEN